ncbi:DNA-methyltransferase [Actinomyces vulturis]|uniref:DNA-methyltransferase n=1 Tax=Actinomyces vulturis TaxID=1857645 RepID=UPI0009F642DB|nr:site-specific DNA-methyltransferase [Actinomyces vulturis]
MLIHGDCAVELPKISSNSVDLVLTDPPYNLGSFMKGRNTNLGAMRSNFFVDAGWDDCSTDQWKTLMDLFLSHSARILKPGGSAVVFMSVVKMETMILLAQKHGFYYKTTGVWHKTNPMPRNMNLHYVNSTELWAYFVYGAKTGTFNNDGKLLHDFLQSSVTPKNEKLFGVHPTQKPLSIMEHFVSTLSNVNDCVLDPFMGSGSSMVAARKLGRRYIGIEKEANYYVLARKRLDPASAQE